MADEAQQQLLTDVKSIRDAEDFSDLAIKCCDDTYLVHKVIVCCRSTVLAKAIKFPGKGAEDKTIDLSDNEPAVVRLLVQYLYEAEYDPVLPTVKTGPSNAIPLQTISHSCARNANGYHCIKGNGQQNRRVCPHHTCGNSCEWNCNDFWCMDCFTVGDAEQLLLHAKMYEIADKYDVAGLKNLCIEKYKRACRKFWDDPKFAESAHHVYCTTPSRDKGLRNIVTKTLSDHMSLEKPEIEDLMTEFNGLAFGLLFDKAKQSGWCNK